MQAGFVIFYYPDQAFALYTTTVPSDPPVDVTITTSGTNAIISWTSEAGRDYNVYSDTDPYGSFAILEGTVTDDSGTFTDPVGGDVKKFYQITTVTTRGSAVIQAAPVLRQISTIRSIRDSKLTDGEKLKNKYL